MRHAITALLLSLIVLPATVVVADMRCGNALILEGDYSYRVRSKCGEPDAIERSVIYKTRPVYRRYRYVGTEDHSVIVEEWTYNFGPNRFIRLLRFENSVLKSVQTAGYGFNEAKK